MLAHPEALLNVPYWEQLGFSEELLNRAGGLAHVSPTGTWGRTDPTLWDVTLLSVRSWEKQQALILRLVKEYKAQGWTITVIGPAAGKPDALGADFFIDNGAPGPDAAYGRINVLANVTLGWMWCCEYAAAMSRKGKFPAVLLSIAMPGAGSYDASIQSIEGRHSTVDCPTAIPAGRLSAAYLKRVGRLIADLKSRHVQGQLRKTADIVARRMAAGGRVGVAGMGHVINEEVRNDNKAPWQGFRIVYVPDTAVKDHLNPGDLLVYYAYAGLNSTTDDYAARIAMAKVDLITCYTPEPELSKNPPPTLAHIDQSWKLPDAEVPIPVFPKAMAPVSGINVTILHRMLDDEVAARLVKLPRKPEAPRLNPFYPEVCDLNAAGFYQNEQPYVAPIQARKWGLVSPDGTQLATMQYDEMGSLSEGMMAVRRGQQWGYLDAKGNEVIAPAFASASAFVNGTARVSRDGKSGLIDPTGHFVLPPQYDQLAEPFYTPTPFLFARTGKQWGLIDRMGKVLVAPACEGLTFFSEQYVGFKSGGKYGLMTPTGKGIVPPKYDYLGRFRRGLAYVCTKDKWGMLGADGKEILPPVYEDLGDFTGDAVPVAINGKWGLITRAGKELLPPKYDQMGRFFDGLSQVRLGTKWGAVDTTGKEVAAPQYEAMKFTIEGMTAVKLQGKWGYIDSTGTLAIPAIYDNALNVSNGKAIVKLDGKWGVLDKTGKVLLPIAYEYLADAGEGYYKFTRGNQWGFLDTAGREVVPPRYTYVLGFSQGRALAAAGGEWSETAGRGPLLVGVKWTLLDATGRELVPPTHDKLLPLGKELVAAGDNVAFMLPQP